MREPNDDRTPIPGAAQELVLNLLGLHTLGRGSPGGNRLDPMPTRVFVTVLGEAGVSESATRTALSRLVKRGMLARHNEGRTSAFALADDAASTLSRGRERIFAPHPFEPDAKIWTVLHCLIPETLRNVRYQVHARLAWAGFGLIQANLWIAPGRVDVEELLGSLVPTEALGLIQAFHGEPAPPSRPGRLVDAAWDLEALRTAHVDFAERWDSVQASHEKALPQLLLLLGDWGQLLRTDPGLPGEYLGPDWPATRSAQLFQRLNSELGTHAEDQLARLLGRHTGDRCTAPAGRSQP